MSQDQFLEEAWLRLSKTAVNGTRVDLLNFIYGLLDDREKNRIIWLHGTAGVGKSAVAFNVAERMRGLKVREDTNVEKRLAGTFFFSREYTTRRTAGYFFATLVYQLARNFPSIRKDVMRAIRDDPILLDPDTPLCNQMEALFLQPLRKLKDRLDGCSPLSFVIDALDECTSEPELVDLIHFLAQALRDPGLPLTHIFVTSRSESHICKAFTGEAIATAILLDGTNVDNDIKTAFFRRAGKSPS